MQLGFVSAILPDLSLEEVFSFARQEGFDCVELMCWPPGAADRRYAGVTHLDVTRLDVAEVAGCASWCRRPACSHLRPGLLPQSAVARPRASPGVAEHWQGDRRSESVLGLGVVNTFIGRDPSGPIEA